MRLSFEEEEGRNGVYAILVGDCRVRVDIHLAAGRFTSTPPTTPY